MPSHIHTLTYTRSGEQISKSVTITKDGEINTDVSLTSTQANKEADINLDVSAMGSLFISSDVACVVRTNATGTSADNTLTLAAGYPLEWYSGSGIANPLTADVTQVFVTNLATTTGTVQIRTLQDNTP